MQGIGEDVVQAVVTGVGQAVTDTIDLVTSILPLCFCDFMVKYMLQIPGEFSTVKGLSGVLFLIEEGMYISAQESMANDDGFFTTPAML